jgi:hypothetical protein
LRYRRILILVVLCLAATALAACGGGAEDPQETLDRVSLQGIESAHFDASLKIESAGKQGGSVDIAVSGQARAEGIAVAATVEGTAEGKPVDFEGGLTLFAKHGFVDYQGTEYEIDPSNYSFAKPLFAPFLSEGGAVEMEACRQAAADVDTEALVTDLRNEGSADVAGAETTKLSGELDVGATIDALAGLAGHGGCRVQFEALSPLPLYRLRQSGDELAQAVKQAKATIYVDDAGLVRRVSATFTADPPGSREPVTVALELSLSEVDASGKIEAPSGAKPIQVLFAKLGINQFEFLNWSRGGEGVRSIGEKVAADAFP